MAETQKPRSPDGSAETERLEAEIEATRRQLGETVGALSRKIDVKSRVQGSASRSTARAKDSLTTDAGRLRPEVPAVGAGILVIVVLLVWRRRRQG